MQNIDPIYLLQPIVVIALNIGLVIYWALKRNFSGNVLIYSLVAYAGAIVAKYIVQIPTLNSVEASFETHSWELGVYYGLQTAIFEVGGAYLIARYAVSKGKFGLKNAEAYGIGLGFWDNGILLGAFSLLSLASTYILIAAGPSTISQQVYNAVSSSQPALFSVPSQALSSVEQGILERISSLLIHFSWGYLCVFAAVFHSYKYFAIALPMGFVDFIVPFAGTVSLVSFELALFALSILAVVVALVVTRKMRNESQTVSLNGSIQS